MYRAKRRWYLTADKKLVPDGHKKAAFLLVGAGSEIPDAEAEQYGLPQAEAALDAPLAAAKAEQPAEDKAVKPAEDKAKPDAAGKPEKPGLFGSRRGANK